MTEHQARQLQRAIERGKRILLAVHERPDGDALGAMFGLASYLRQPKREVVAFSADGVPPVFRFLPQSDRVVQRLPKPLAFFDVVILLDCGDVKRAHLPFNERRNGQPQIINIDHHPTGTKYCGVEAVDLNIVEIHESSTCEMLYDYLIEIGATITKDVATCLLTGICTDTGNFSNLGTTRTCLVAAARLLLFGASLPKIVEATERNKSVGMLKLWGRALSRLKKDEATGMVTTVVRQVDLQECDVDIDAVEGISNFLNSLDEAEVVLVLKEDEQGMVRGSYRTTRSNVNVAMLAKEFGGGGHKKAAGFTVKGRLVETPTGWRIVRNEETAKKP